MSNLFNRVSSKQKAEIAESLICALTTDAPLSRKAGSFVTEWVMSGPEEKYKAFFDIWGMVLSGYMPTTRPVLYRSCLRRMDGKIASFTASINSAEKFSEGRSFLLICDTKLPLDVIPRQKQGEYQHTFFPLTELFQREARKPDSPLSHRFLENYTKEDEYIMRIDLNWMYSLKWIKRGE